MIHNLRGRSTLATPVLRVRSEQHGAPGVAIAYTETFPNDGDMSVTAEDLTWNVTAGVVQVVSGQATGATLGEAFAQTALPSTDMFVQAELANTDSGDTLFLVGRANTDGTTDGVYLYIEDDGADTYIELGGWAPASGVIDSDTLTSSTADATWRLELQGTSALCFRNGVQVLSGIPNVLADGLYAGFQMNSGGSPPEGAIDNFTYGEL